MNDTFQKFVNNAGDLTEFAIGTGQGGFLHGVRTDDDAWIFSEDGVVVAVCIAEPE